MQLTKSEKTRASLRRILVVDDEPAILELISDVIVQRLRCRVSVAQNVREAQRIITGGEEIDLLVTDINLPDGEGTALLTSLQENQPAASAIVITGAASLNGAVNAMRRGRDRFSPQTIYCGFSCRPCIRGVGGTSEGRQAATPHEDAAECRSQTQ